MSKGVGELRAAIAAIDHRLAAALVRNATNADRLYAVIRQAIAELVLEPNEVISEKDLAAVLGVSKTPVREALIRLSVEGLVLTLPRSGTFVSPIVSEDLFEAMVIREALEGTAVRLAARKADQGGKFLLKETMRRQMEAVANRDVMSFHRTDDDLHRDIVTISGLKRLWTLLETVRVPLNRVRYLAAPVPGRIEMLAVQHQAIVDAIVANRAEEAGRAMQAHLDALYPFVETLLSERPELFATSGDAKHSDMGKGHLGNRRSGLRGRGRAPRDQTTQDDDG